MMIFESYLEECVFYYHCLSKLARSDGFYWSYLLWAVFKKFLYELEVPYYLAFYTIPLIELDDLLRILTLSLPLLLNAGGALTLYLEISV